MTKASFAGHPDVKLGWFDDSLRRASEVPGVTRVRDFLARPSLKPVLCCIWLLLLTVWSFHHQIFQNWSFPWDFYSTPTTTPAFVADTFGRGHLLSWDPFVASGFPVAVDPQAGVYFPLWWLLGLLRIAVTVHIAVLVQVFHTLFAALGVLALARARGLAYRWALLAATAYVFFGAFYGESEHTPYIFGFAYLPWLLWSLTPPREGGSWKRLAALPFIGWLIASGAYPGDVASFGIIGVIYFAFALRGGPTGTWRRWRVALILAVASTVALTIAVLLPYYLASRANGLWRPAPPTAGTRAYWAFTPDDLFGLYLNPFAWRPDGTITAWAVGTPMLIGLFLIRKRELLRQLPLLVIGVAGLTLAMTPKIGPIGRLMAGPLTQLFPSRFPAADYKGAITLAIVLLAAEGWAAMSDAGRGRRATALIVGVLLIVGAILAPSQYASPTRTMWLLITVVVITVAVAIVYSRPRAGVLVCVLLALVAVDGWRDARDNLLQGTTSSWLITPADAVGYGQTVRDQYIERLPALLAAKPKSRPARTAPTLPLSEEPGGINNDNLGWVADGYRLIDYGGTVEEKLRRVEVNPVWVKLMLEPWHAFTFACSAVDCENGQKLPAIRTWGAPSSQVKTLSYSATGIVYSVNVTKPTLMVENELGLKGWESNNPKAMLVSTRLPFRAWKLKPGRYTFTATYHQPGFAVQTVAALCALLLAIAMVFVIWRQRQRLAAEPLTSR